MKSHRPIEQKLHKRTWKFICGHLISTIALVGSIVTILGFLLYLHDKKIDSISGVLTASQTGSVKYISVGATRFIVDSPDGVFLRDGELPVLSVRLINERLLVSTSIRNKVGEIIAELKDNEWKLNKDTIFDRNYTDHILEVRDRWGKVAIQVVHFGDTIHLAGIFRCQNGWATALGPVGRDGAVMDIKPPGKDPHYEIPAICEYPSERHFGSCPGIASLKKLVRHGEGPAYRMGGSLNLCNKTTTPG